MGGNFGLPEFTRFCSKVVEYPSALIHVPSQHFAQVALDCSDRTVADRLLAALHPHPSHSVSTYVQASIAGSNLGRAITDVVRFSKPILVDVDLPGSKVPSFLCR